MSSGFLQLSQVVRKESYNSGTQSSPTHDRREIIMSRMLVELFTPSTSWFTAVRVISFYLSGKYLHANWKNLTTGVDLTSCF
jgi:hypothetical protein